MGVSSHILLYMLYMLYVVPLSHSEFSQFQTDSSICEWAEWVFEKSQIIESFVATNFLVML